MTGSPSHKGDGIVKYQRELAGTIDYIHNYGLDTDKREIYMFGRDEYAWHSEEGAAEEPGVDYTMANQFIKNLRILQSLGDDPIIVHMKTSGGDWMEGMAIYQAILTCPVSITILNYTHARSMSSIIFQAADWRVMMPYSTFMMHRGTVCFDGTVTSYATEYEQGLKADKQMLDIYVQRMKVSDAFTGWTLKRIEKWILREMKDKEEVYLSAEEAVRYNLADAVFGSNGTFDWNGLR